MNIAFWIAQILLAAIGLLAIQMRAVFTGRLPKKEFNVIASNVVLIAISRVHPVRMLDTFLITNLIHKEI